MQSLKEIIQNFPANAYDWQLSPIREWINPRAEECVYFLMEKGKIVYVGKSVGLHSRLRTHIKNNIPFDEAFFIEVEPKWNLHVEYVFAFRFQPKYCKYIPSEKIYLKCVKSLEDGIDYLTKEDLSRGLANNYRQATQRECDLCQRPVGVAATQIMKPGINTLDKSGLKVVLLEHSNHTICGMCVDKLVHDHFLTLSSVPNP